MSFVYFTILVYSAPSVTFTLVSLALALFLHLNLRCCWINQTSSGLALHLLTCHMAPAELSLA